MDIVFAGKPDDLSPGLPQTTNERNNLSIRPTQGPRSISLAVSEASRFAPLQNVPTARAFTYHIAVHRSLFTVCRLPTQSGSVLSTPTRRHADTPIRRYPTRRYADTFLPTPADTFPSEQSSIISPDQRPPKSQTRTDTDYQLVNQNRLHIDCRDPSSLQLPSSR